MTTLTPAGDGWPGPYWSDAYGEMVPGVRLAHHTGSAQCQWCGMWHDSVCSRIAAIEYHRDGTVKRVTFRPTTEAP